MFLKIVKIFILFFNFSVTNSLIPQINDKISSINLLEKTNKLVELSNLNSNDNLKNFKQLDNINLEYINIFKDKISELSETNKKIFDVVPNYIDKIKPTCDCIVHQINYSIIKIISSILPHVDSIGHRILHLDDVLINQIINSDIFTPELKKDIVLAIIKISQNGDNFGSIMLQFYYDLIDKLM